MAEVISKFTALRQQEPGLFESFRQGQQAGLQRQAAQQALAIGGLQQQRLQQQIAAGDIELQEAQKTALAKSIWKGARQVMSAEGNPAAQQRILEGRIQSILANDPDADVSDSLENLQLRQQGRTDEADAQLRDAIASTGAFLQDPTELRKQQELALEQRGLELEERELTFKEREAEAKRSEAQIKQDLKLTGDRFDDAAKLRGEIFKASKEFKDVNSAFGRIQASAEDPSAAGDLALVFNFMKMLDPGSTVREGEFATAAAAAGLGQRFIQAAKKIDSGEILSPAQRKDFMDRAKKLFDTAKTINDEEVGKFISIGEQTGISKDLLLGAQPEVAGQSFTSSGGIQFTVE